MHEHKTKLMKNYHEDNIKGMIEVLLSLRVNILQIAPELRKNLVYELIRNDIFHHEECDYVFLLEILNIPNPKLEPAIVSLVSVIASTLKGLDYLTQDKENVVIRRIIEVRWEIRLEAAYPS